MLDSRGNPTIEVDVHLSGGEIGTAIVPSGASVGAYEAVELRDKTSTRYFGRGVLQAIANVNETIAPALVQLDPTEQQLVDTRLLELDATHNKNLLGANAILGVSLAVLDAAAQAIKTPLYQHVNDLFDNVPMRMPVPLMNLLNGGAHANNSVVFQEFMVLPVTGGSFREALRAGVEVFHTLKSLLQESMPPLSTAVGDEGGFAPDLSSNYAAVAFLAEAISVAGYSLGEDLFIGLDCAATEYWSESGYQIEPNSDPISGAEVIDYLERLKAEYPAVISIEDGWAEECWEDWIQATEQLASTTQLVGDDVFVTNEDRFSRGIECGAGNSILVKLNQVGTVTETLNVMRMAHENGYSTVVSHRSGDTEDTKIADLAVGTGAGQIKTGSASRSERIAKYNRLLRIEEQLDSVPFLGAGEFHRFRAS